MWSQGNGGLSLAEIDKAVAEGAIGHGKRATNPHHNLIFTEGSDTVCVSTALGAPDFNHKQALMRAYMAADTSGDGFIERSELAKLLVRSQSFRSTS